MFALRQKEELFKFAVSLRIEYDITRYVLKCVKRKTHIPITTTATATTTTTTMTASGITLIRKAKTKFIIIIRLPIPF